MVPELNAVERIRAPGYGVSGEAVQFIDRPPVKD